MTRVWRKHRQQTPTCGQIRGERQPSSPQVFLSPPTPLAFLLLTVLPPIPQNTDFPRCLLAMFISLVAITVVNASRIFSRIAELKINR